MSQFGPQNAFQGYLVAFSIALFKTPKVLLVKGGPHQPPPLFSTHLGDARQLFYAPEPLAHTSLSWRMRQLMNKPITVRDD